MSQNAITPKSTLLSLQTTHADKGLSSPQKVGRVSFGVSVVIFDKFFAGFF